MATQKHIKLTGISNVSWKDAINQTILEASNTIHNINDVIVLDQRAKIDNGKIIEYYATIDLTFTIEPNREDSDE